METRQKLLETIRRRDRHTLAAGLLASLIGLVAPGISQAEVNICTSDADFDAGNLDGVDQVSPGELELAAIGSTFPVMWIANAGEDTVSRIDTDANCEVARYRTWFAGSHLNNAFVGPAPSRTAVDGDANVYVANRWFSPARPATLLKILSDGGIDRNGNGVIDTSFDANGDCSIQPGEIIPLVDLNSNGLLEDNELADERVVWARNVGPQPLGHNNGLGRSVCIDPEEDIWVGLFNRQEYWEFDSDGNLKSGPHSVSPITPYGCLVDRNGVLWSADRGGGDFGRKIGKFDTVSKTLQGVFNHGGIHYSLALGSGPSLGKLFLAIEDSNSYLEFDTTTNVFTSRPGTSGRGISVDGAGDIVNGRATVQKHRPDGSLVWSTGHVNFDNRGVLVDSGNDVWIVNKDNNSVSKFDGVTGAFITTLPVGNQPYTYSDATGFGFRNVTNPSGFWTLVRDGGTPGVKWDGISWNNEPEGNVPPGASISVEARAGDDQNNLPNNFVQAVNGATGLGEEGQFIEVRVKLEPDAQDISPVLSDISIHSLTDCDVDADGDIDINDLRSMLGRRNQPASGPDDPMDPDGDGIISVLDVRICSLRRGSITTSCI